MQRSSLIFTVLVAGFGLMAPVGHDAMVVGISHWFASVASFTFGGLRWMPRMAMSEQCTAPHILRQQARAILTRAGSFVVVKYSWSSSMTAFTTPEASVAGVWQCTQPWVCTTLLMP